ncbi:MAG: hypothetical protein AAF363_01015 [Bacteroidota bacterium]
MEFKDLIVTPFYLILLYAIAFLIRPYFTKAETRKYFIPALTVKFIGAIAVGIIYQFYYGGGDTFTYFHLGSKWIWEAFLENPKIAFQLIFGGMEYTTENYSFASKIYSYGDEASYFVVRFGGILSILSANTYSTVAVGFAFWSFLGVWQIYSVFSKIFPNLHKPLAYGILFLPSLFFWGSGLLKDSITLGALGFLFHACYQIIEEKRNVVFYTLIALFMIWIIQIVKIYILLAFMPAIIYWIYLKFKKFLKPSILKTLASPLLLVLFLFVLFISSRNLSQDSRRYNFEKVLVTAEETAKWNYYVSDVQGGSGYSLGDYDFSPTGLAKKFVPAVLTTIFRPTLFETRNVVMLLTAVENLILFILFLNILRKGNRRFVHSYDILTFCILFVILFSFAVGITTYNFGTLARYRIPMLPFLMVWLIAKQKRYSVSG